MKKVSKHHRRLTLSAEKLRELSRPLTDQQLEAAGGGMTPTINGCPGCDCSSAWC